MRKFAWLTFALGGLACAAGPAAAEPLTGWVVDLGARVGASPDYEGSDRTKARVTPVINVRKANPVHRYTPPDPGAYIGLLATDRITVGPVVTLRSKRDADGELAGLRRVKRAAEVGAFADVWPLDWLRLHAEARKGVTGHSGWLGDAGFDLVAGGERWDASIGPRVGWADDRYMETYFGVTPQEAAANPGIAAAYAPSGGAAYVGARVGAAYYLSDRWRISADASYRRLGDKAARSPIVRTFGSRKQLTAGIGLAYSFGLPFDLD
jgi:outer membrane scaffolding protein for murein synthesis (MipA/OmpV family)